MLLTVSGFKRTLLFSAASSALLCAIPAWAETSPQESDDRVRATTLDKLVVTAHSPGAPSTTPVQVLSGDELAHRRQGGLGETLAGFPGIHLDNFGGGASRPVIRGQTTPRIEILSDGANLFDASSVSPDHAITADPLLLDSIEVLRGPAAARYGGNAVNGAINLIDSKVPKAVPHGGLTGATELRYGTGDEEKTGAGRVTAGVGQFAIHAEGSRRKADDYAVPNAYGSTRLADSFVENTSHALGASWITKKGYIGAAYSRMDSEYGLPGHSHVNSVCHTHGLDLHCGAHGQWAGPGEGWDDSHTAFIKLRSERTDVRADYENLLPGIDLARLRLSYTDYLHDEFDGPFRFSHYTNEVYDGRLELTHAPLFGFSGTFGAQYTDGTFSGINVNDAYEPQPDFGFPTTVDYVTRNKGVFLSEHRAFGAVAVELAARKDWREMSTPVPDFRYAPEDIPEMVIIEQLLGLDPGERPRDGYIALVSEGFRTQHPTVKHAPVSASVSAAWTITDEYSAALSLARSERAPTVRELWAYGNNLATNSYEVGLGKTRQASRLLPESRTDVIETTKSINLTLRKTGGAFGFELGVFHQDADAYIFARLLETETEAGAPHHYLVYTAADASLTGLDGQVSYDVSPESRVTVFGDYVETRLKRENDHLPRIPPARLGARYAGSWGALSADIEYFRTFGQTRIASYETTTRGYDMVNATLAYRIEAGTGQSVEFYARGANLTNELAFSHTSFVKDQSPLRGRNIVLGVRHRF